jgi:hypothetical protein
LRSRALSGSRHFGEPDDGRTAMDFDELDAGDWIDPHGALARGRFDL